MSHSEPGSVPDWPKKSGKEVMGRIRSKLNLALHLIITMNYRNRVDLRDPHNFWAAEMPKALAQTKRAAGLLLNKAAKVVR